MTATKAEVVSVEIPMTFKKRGGRKVIVLPDGRYGYLDGIAKAEKIAPSFVSRVIRLALLAPDIVEGVGLLVWWCVVPGKKLAIGACEY